jgi:hypothetical protein
MRGRLRKRCVVRRQVAGDAHWTAAGPR